MRLAGDVRCPTLLVIAEYDEIAPSTAVHEVARRIGPLAEVVSYDCGHFAIYAGEEFEDSVGRQVEFLERVLGRDGRAGQRRARVGLASMPEGNSWS